ncbi:GNAT family N-acetyltransferase [Piscinibacter sp. XHJ-5]|uniref:GNAT family N-acetyltransferase n=1 Tax=Piscinibacter sp. XHJ-5 TaxID=3037797 RepID=UPI002452F7EA|nr:GNAT family N-acetyltransferase [Piscinibacter sp. XHJ-5]
MRTLSTVDLVLEPLTVGHAEAMFEVLREPALYRYLDYPAPSSIEHLRSVYSRIEGRKSPDGKQLWLNWVVHPPGAAPIGYVQATVTARQTGWIGFVFSSKHWNRGYATQAARAVVEHVAAAYGVVRFLATVDAENQRSIRLLGRLGFHEATQAESQGHDLSPNERLFVR